MLVEFAFASVHVKSLNYNLPVSMGAVPASNRILIAIGL